MLVTLGTKRVTKIQSIQSEIQFTVAFFTHFNLLIHFCFTLFYLWYLCTCVRNRSFQAFRDDDFRKIGPQKFTCG